ncbi:MAG TPA: alkaline phosphatase family protein [Polyangia bacterium]|nr:alkaline phosphatase family protein [Polyangia bacterium]
MIPSQFNGIGKHLLAFLVPAFGLLAACGPNTSGNTLAECRPLTATAAQRPAGWNGTVFTIVMENHSRDSIIGNAAAPFINGLAKQYAVAAGYHDSYVHPSEPNYIWMVAGQNFGILNDDDPSPNQVITSQSHLANQIEKAGLTWKSYQESMGQPCGLKSHGLYAVKHNPFAYFSDINGWDGTAFKPSERCSQHIVDYSQLDADIAAGTVPNYVFITPNMVNDMHDGSIADGDRWLSAEVPKITNTDAFKQGGVLFLLWDEGTSQSDDPPFLAISPNAKPAFVSQTDYDTSSFLKTVQSIMGLETLPCSPQPAAVNVMDDLFTVPMAPAAAP